MLSPKIVPYTNEYRLFDLINGVSEFVNFGRSDTLAACFSSKDETTKQLIRAMNNISDAISLGKTASLLDLLSTLNSAIDKFQNEDYDDAALNILKDLLDIIRSKMFLKEGREPDTLSVIHWCLENKFLQQAITIYNEHLPKYLFEHKIIECKNPIDLENARNNAFHTDAYAYLFYGEFMSCRNNSARIKDKIDFIKFTKRRLNERSYKFKVAPEAQDCIGRICASYTFFKEVRNSINHAGGRGSDKTILKNFLEKEYNPGFSYEISTANLTRILNRELKVFDKLMKKMKNKQAKK